MEVKIGVQFAPRELSLESNDSQADIEKAVAEALQGRNGLLSLVDEKGRRVLIPSDKIAYVEIAEQEIRRVGFGTT